MRAHYIPPRSGGCAGGLFRWWDFRWRFLKRRISCNRSVKLAWCIYILWNLSFRVILDCCRSWPDMAFLMSILFQAHRILADCFCITYLAGIHLFCVALQKFPQNRDLAIIFLHVHQSSVFVRICWFWDVLEYPACRRL